jgi:hypothetical protein
MAFHHPDDGVSMHVWNIGLLQRDYTALYPRRVPSSLWKRFLTWSTQYFTFPFGLVSKNANIRHTKHQATSHAKHRLSGVSRVEYCPAFRQTLQLPSSRWALVGRLFLEWTPLEKTHDQELYFTHSFCVVGLVVLIYLTKHFSLRL